MTKSRRAAAACLLVAVPLVVGVSQLAPTQEPEPTRVSGASNERLVCPLAPVKGAVQTAADKATATPLSDDGASVVTAIGDQPVAAWYSAGSTWATACTAPSATAWLISPKASQLYLVNPERVAASVNLAIQGPDGDVQAQGSTGIVVPAHSERVVPLSVMVTTPGPVAVRLSTDTGRVAAYVRTTLDAQGDFVGPTTPDTSTILPGVPAKASKVTVFVANPGDARTAVTVEAMGPTGAVALTGGQFDVSARSVRAVDLTAGVAGEAVALRVTSDAPTVSVAEVTVNGDVAYLANPDHKSVGGTQWAVAGSVLQIANPSTNDETITVRLSTKSQVKVVAGGIAEVAIPEDAWVDVSGGAGAIRTPGPGLGVVTLKASPQAPGGLALSPDPRVGR